VIFSVSTDSSGRSPFPLKPPGGISVDHFPYEASAIRSLFFSLLTPPFCLVTPASRDVFFFCRVLKSPVVFFEYNPVSSEI